MFNHEKMQCGSASEEVNEHDTAQGLLKLGSYALSDYTLYEIMEPIPDGYNLYLSGWSALPKAPSSQVVEDPSDDDEDDDEFTQQQRPKRSSTTQIPIVGIHHPSGDSKKISIFTNGTLPKACWAECAPDEYFHWQIPRWTEGTTEPGSSGSPLFDADKRIVGQLHGGSASCWNPNGYDVYGGLYASFQTPPKIKNRLATYLDPEGTGAKILDGYSLEAARHHHHSRQYSGKQGSQEEQEQAMVRVGPLGHPSLVKPFLEEEHERHSRSAMRPEGHPRHHSIQRDRSHLRHGSSDRLFRLESSIAREDLAPRVMASLGQVWDRLFQGRVSIEVHPVQEDDDI